MEHPKTTPKDFFLWAGAMIALYVSAISFIRLVFDYINYVFPDALNSYYYSDPYSGSVSFEIASLIVLFPVFLVLMRVIRNLMMVDASRRDIWIRRWALYLTVFIAGVTIAGDLITLLYYFLSGQDITIRFVLKVAVVLLVAGGGFMHFLADLWGYWIENPQLARRVGWATGALIVVTIFAGFFIIGTPWQARQYRLDDRRVTDLQSLQSEILSFYQQKQTLPSALTQLQDPTIYYTVPTDPSTGAQYEYRKTADLSFELCATFAAATRANANGRNVGITMPASPYGGPGISGENNWLHQAGRSCFSRTVDPDFYPPINKPVR
jgi:hypothetical protein